MFFKDIFNRFGSPKPTFSVLHQVHQYHKPQLKNEKSEHQLWRHESIGKTLEYITNEENYQKLKQYAADNLATWSQQTSQTPSIVEVVEDDWGKATLSATKNFGHQYVVLNMANPFYPGGDALHGGGAQEENLFHRTTVPRTYLTSHVQLDKDQNQFIYTDTGKKLVQGLEPLSSKEKNILKAECSDLNVEESYRVYFNPETQVCFRGPEVYKNLTEGQNADIENSFSFLQIEEIFPFHEMRSAAPYNNLYLARSQSEFNDMLRQKIKAQLDTLILEHQTHVILGAWGCGAFRNDPNVISRIYAEEIEKRAKCFKHILFPVIDIGIKKNNFEIFNTMLTGIPLGSKVESKKVPPKP
jgi:hypothetical protein